jgi:hypothetical protein
MNWGNKLLLTFIVFGCGIFFLVYSSMNVETELVSKEYYKDELSYQRVIDGTNSANQLTGDVRVTQQGENIMVQLPGEMKHAKVSGTISFYCAADAKKDKQLPLQLNDEAVQQIEKKFLLPGNYTVKLDWEHNQKHYYSQKSLTIL